MIRFKKCREVKSPSRGNPLDAGVDFYVPDKHPCVRIKPGESVNIPSGIKIEILPNTVGLFLNKSGIARKGLIVGAQVIDCGYTGEVHLSLHNIGTEEVIIGPGQKVAQMLIMPVSVCDLTEMGVNYEIRTFDSTRGEGAFGSTGES